MVATKVHQSAQDGVRFIEFTLATGLARLHCGVRKGDWCVVGTNVSNGSKKTSTIFAEKFADLFLLCRGPPFHGGLSATALPKPSQAKLLAWLTYLVHTGNSLFQAVDHPKSTGMLVVVVVVVPFGYSLPSRGRQR